MFTVPNHIDPPPLVARLAFAKMARGSFMFIDPVRELRIVSAITDIAEARVSRDPWGRQLAARLAEIERAYGFLGRPIDPSTAPPEWHDTMARCQKFYRATMLAALIEFDEMDHAEGYAEQGERYFAPMRQTATALHMTVDTGA